MNLSKAIVIDRLRELMHRDPRLAVFGANGHRYLLNPPLPIDEFEVCERRHAVAFPEDYKFFVTQIGNGGAGPFYGLFPFGKQDNLNDFCNWESGGLIGILGEPFLHKAPWNLTQDFWDRQPNPLPNTPIEEEDRMMAEWDTQLDEHYWAPHVMNGAIPICHIGCALRQWLVVNGPQKGFVWNDFRADSRGLFPVSDAHGKYQTFSEWYMGWLRDPVAAMKMAQ